MSAPAAKLIVVMAFDPDENGDLQPAVEPVEYQSEARAVQAAKMLATKHAGVIAWSREARPLQGEYGEPIELFRKGSVPPLD